MHRRVLTVVLIATVVTAAACSSSSKSSSSSSSSSSASPSTTAGGLDAAIAAVTQAEQGTNRPVDPTPRPAAKGKHIVVISSGQASISSQVPSDAAVAAAKAAGWQVDLYDAKLNPANYPTLVRQAVAAGVDGIVLDAIDCQTAQQPLAEAKAKGIVVVPIYAFDCNDAHAGNGPTGYYSSQINFGSKANADIDAFAESFGVDQANYIIADSKNTAKIIDIQDPEFTVLYYTLTGFDNTIKASGGSQVVSTLNITSADILAPAKLVAKIQAEVLRHPEATWIKSPYTYATLLGIVPALAATPNIHLKVMGSEGFQPELDLVRANKVAAVNIISSEWVGWAAVDTMNSLFRKETPVDSGIGWTLTDLTHNLPTSGPFNPPIDFKASYKKAWGVG